MVRQVKTPLSSTNGLTTGQPPQLEVFSKPAHPAYETLSALNRPLLLALYRQLGTGAATNRRLLYVARVPHPSVPSLVMCHRRVGSGTLAPVLTTDALSAALAIDEQSAKGRDNIVDGPSNFKQGIVPHAVVASVYKPRKHRRR